MPEILPTETCQQLLVNNTPLIDVRAPTEYARGSFPAAVNLPLLDDSEREEVGTRYHQAGQEAAIELGQQLVSGDTRQQRLEQWTGFLDAHPNAALFCFRGGLRSRTAQQWLEEAGYRIPRIAGGYKAIRRLLVDTIDQASATLKFLVVAGKTGCAKTRLVNQLPASLDLEGLANHRGSAFGRRVEPQPTQINFENALAIQLLRLPFTDYERLVLEDEGHAIGSLSVPLELFRKMRQEPIAVIEEPLSYRVQTVLHAYVEINYSDFVSADPDTAVGRFSEYLQSSLQRIQRRLGKPLYDEISQDLETAIHLHFQFGDIEPHKVWIEKLLKEYYDPMYEYQLEKKLHRMVFRGDSEEFLHWAAGLRFRKR